MSQRFNIEHTISMHSGGTKFYELLQILPEDDPEKEGIFICRWGKASCFHSTMTGQRSYLIANQPKIRAEFAKKYAEKWKGGYEDLARANTVRVEGFAATERLLEEYGYRMLASFAKEKVSEPNSSGIAIAPAKPEPREAPSHYGNW